MMAGEAASLLTLVEGMPQLVWRAVDQGLWTWSSPQWQRFTGQSAGASSGTGWLDALHPEDRDAALAAWDRAAEQGEYHAETRVSGRDGTFRWFRKRASPVRSEDGAIVEWLGTSTDVDDLRRRQAEQEVLVAELQHRTRNLLAVVTSISAETLRSAPSLVDFKDRFESRLAALARVQGLLSASEHEPITIRKLLTMELAALAAHRMTDQVNLSGPRIIVRDSSAQTMALAVHELSTNALKYGALMSPAGRLSVSWFEHVEDGQPWLCLQWRESGINYSGDALDRPKGYGRLLIEQALPHQLGARTEFRIASDSLYCSIDLPLRHYRSGDSHG